MNRPTATSLPALVIAAFAGAVVLAFADAPQSVGLVFKIGVDHPSYAGEQLAVALAGALATALAVLFAAQWRWLLPAGALGVLVAHLMFNPGWEGITARVVDVNDDGAPVVPEFARQLPWMCLGIASAGVLLVGLLGAVQRLYRLHPVGASAAVVVACAGYLGASVVGPLRAVDMDTVRLVVLAVAFVLTGAALVTRESADPTPELPTRARLAAAGAVVLTVAPTVLVAVTGKTGFGTALGGVVGLLVLAAAVFAAVSLGRNALLAVTAAGLALAAPVTILIPLADALVVGWADSTVGVLTLLAVAGASGAALFLGRLVAAAGVLGVTALVMLWMASGLVPEAPTFFSVLLLMFGMASVGLAVGSTAPFFAHRNALPAAGAVITTMALGVHLTLSFLRIGSGAEPNLDMVWGRGAFIVAGVLLAIAAVLLVLLHRLGRVRTSGPLDDYRRVFTATGPVPPETR